ncbi:MAG: FecR domain-containing protein [Steroidobacteraceae bacterium]|nr:FecR domain-containing protein [Steroidobacteraceae bacterium]
MSGHTPTSGQDDQDLAALLAAAGPRVQPSSLDAAQVRAAVEAEWRDAVDARRQRRRYATWGAAASLAVAAVGIWVARPWLSPPGEVVATLTRVTGVVEANSGKGRWTPVVDGSEVTTGTRLRTGTGGRAALALGDALAVRLDTHTQVTLADAGHAALDEGAVYVDAGATRGTQAPRFDLETPAGIVRHLGTQYEARLARGALSVGVREGRVSVDGRSGQVTAGAGERLVIADGRIERERLDPHGAAWTWVGTVTPPFSIEGRSVEDFLAWAGRETGRQIVYASPEAEARARSVTLRGTVEGLTPDEAVAAVLATTTLEPVIEPSHIRVEAASR